MKTIQAILLSLVLVLITSCATTYQRSGFAGGYESYQVSDNIYMVTFSGNGYTSNQQAWLFFLTRAAEIAREAGYSGFYVIESQDLTLTSQYTTQGYARSNTTGNVSGNYYQSGNTSRLYGTITSTTSTTYTPPQTYNISKPSYMGQIMLVNERIDGAPEPFNASMVYSTGISLNESIKQSNMIKGILFWGGVGVLTIIGLASGG